MRQYNILKKTLFIILLIAMTFSIFAVFSKTKAESGDLRLLNLDFDVTVNKDGSIDVIEKWNIDIEETNTRYKTFAVSGDDKITRNYTNVSVYEVQTDGTKTAYAKTDTYAYHLSKGTYYALMEKGKFEIAWGVSVTNKVKQYEIHYTIQDAVTNQKDSAQLYWQLQGNDFEVPIRSFTAKIKLPENTYKADEIKIWAHGPLNGNINHSAESSSIIEMEASSISSKTMIESRIVVPKDMFTGLKEAKNSKTVEEIITEETKLANAANEKRLNAKRIKDTINIVKYVVGIGVIVLFVRNIVKKTKKIKETKVIEPEQKVDYYRDIPGENAHPGEAGFLYYYKQSGLEGCISKILSGTILNLSLKGFITFREKESTKKNKEVIIELTSDKGAKKGNTLSQYEAQFYNLLKKVAKSITDKELSENELIDKDIKKYASRNNSTFLKTIEDIKKNIIKEQEQKGNFDKKSYDASANHTASIVGYAMALITSIILIPWICVIAIIICIINIVQSYKLYKMTKTFTQKGENEAELWKGLKKYMEEYSLLKDKDTFDVALWEQFLVYATTFGISKKVLEQLKVAYPEFADNDYIFAHYGYSYLYFASNDHFSNTISSSINSAVSTANYSSGSGGGGGFSGGGGRRIRWWWRWWQITPHTTNI